MAADSEGNDLEQAFIPVTGFVAAQLTGTPTFVESAAVKTTPLTLPEGYVKLGLVKQDGAPQSGGDKGDDIEFWQQGYKIGGEKTRTMQVTLAEFNKTVRQLITGKEPDENGMIVVEGDNDAMFPLFEAVKAKNGWVRFRNGMAHVSTVEPDQDTRGENAGNAVTFEWLHNDTIGGFYREWYLKPTTAAKTNHAPANPAGSDTTGKTAGE